MEDNLPRIYREETGVPYPGKPLDDNLVLRAEEMSELADLCGEDRLHYELTRELLSVTNQQRTSGRRAGLFDQLEKTFGKHFYDGKADALDRATRLLADKARVKDRIGALSENGGEAPANGEVIA
jgi:DNA sulfur modification protein DndC